MTWSTHHHHRTAASGVHGEPTLHIYCGMDGLLPRGCVLWGSPASSTVPDPHSRLYMAGKAKTSFPISFNKTYKLGVYYFPELSQPCCDPCLHSRVRCNIWLLGPALTYGFLGFPKLKIAFTCLREGNTKALGSEFFVWFLGLPGWGCLWTCPLEDRVILSARTKGRKFTFPAGVWPQKPSFLTSGQDTLEADLPTRSNWAEASLWAVS